MSATCRRSRDPPRRVPASSATRSSAVVVAVPEAEPAVAAHRRRLDRAAGWGVPAHVTVLYPFVPPDRIDHTTIAALAEAGVTVHGDERVLAHADGSGATVVPATAEDWETEYLSYDIAACVVDDLGLPRGYRFPPTPQPPRPLHDAVDVHCSRQVRWGCTRVERHEYTLQLSMSEMREHTYRPFPQEGEATSSR